MSRFISKIVYKKELVDQIYLVVLEAQQNLKFTPGQFVSLEVAPNTYRSYSISHLDSQPFFLVPKDSLLPIAKDKLGAYITLMVSARAGGLGSQYFKEAKLGQTLNCLGPAGRFKLNKQTSNNKVFVCTGTGLAPFVAMIKKAFEDQPEIKIRLFFGSYNRKSDFCQYFYSKPELQNPNLQVYSCIDKEQFEETKFQKMGQVKDVITKTISRLEDWEYYLCGHPLMVESMQNFLMEAGLAKDKIFKEAFG